MTTHLSRQQLTRDEVADCRGSTRKKSTRILVTSSLQNTSSMGTIVCDSPPPTKRQCRPFQRRKFRRGGSNRRSRRKSATEEPTTDHCYRRIDLKDWPSDLPLPSVSPTVLTSERVGNGPHFDQSEMESDVRAEWKTPWESTFDESGASTDVGFTTSIASTYSGINWNYEGPTSPSWGSKGVIDESGCVGMEVFGPAWMRSRAMVCEDRLTTWRKEESSPMYFMLTLLIVMLLAALMSPELSPWISSLSSVKPEASHVKPFPSLLPSTVSQKPSLNSAVAAASASASPLLTSSSAVPVVDSPGRMRNKSTLLFPSYDLPVAFEIQPPGTIKDLNPRFLWSTYGPLRRKNDALRLTVFSVGAAITIYAWRWF
eukprot:Gregarina_sp_Poly_1__2838@NODE_1791_length_3323_cov_291_952703_g313_i2_p2_GENE_NODE_1791_length_3323_cov_291_952703_g313_i2NODE_1791_length_3323_cov_291_952703_g313_i2_p2_ORF_typecomplete_len371_score28_08_NODE_1791_length_3323_cov_291_952703_g313_i216052717